MRHKSELFRAFLAVTGLDQRSIGPDTLLSCLVQFELLTITGERPSQMERPDIQIPRELGDAVVCVSSMLSIALKAIW